MSGNSIERREFKIIILGQISVGKTSLIHRYIHNNFKEYVPATIGNHFHTEKAIVDNGEAYLQIWDTAGLERFNAINQFYYRKANAAIICVDLTKSISYSKLNYWIDEIMLDETECKIYICCTKNDLLRRDNRVISDEDIKSKAEICNGKVFVTSSKTGEGVYEMFQEIASDLLISNINDESDTIRLKASNNKKRICCSRF